MRQTNYLTPVLDISKYTQYLHFYRLLHDKKRNINYTHLLMLVLLKFKYFHKYVTADYVRLFFYSFYKNPLYVSNITYLYIYNKCKYVNENLYIDLVRNSYVLDKQKFLFTSSKFNSVEEKLVGGRLDNQFNLILGKQNYLIYSHKFKPTQLSFPTKLVYTNISLLYANLQILYKFLL